MDTSSQTVAATKADSGGIGGMLVLAFIIGMAFYFTAEEKKS